MGIIISFLAQSDDFGVDLSELSFYFKCFALGEMATLMIPVLSDAVLEGTEVIGFQIQDASNISMAFGNIQEIQIKDNGNKKIAMFM